MAFATINFESKGIQKEAPVGFSWTTLFFGFFPALFRGDWKWAAIILVASMVTFGFSNIIIAFFYNRLYAQGLMKQGYKVKNYLGDKRLIEEKAQIKLKKKYLFDYFKIIQKTVVDLENYNFNKYLILITFLTIIISLVSVSLVYYLFYETFFEAKSFDSQIPLINKIYNSYLFYLVILTLKVLLGFTIIGLIMVPVGTIVTGIFADKIFDINK